MICPGIENKYGFDMRVSAEPIEPPAIGSTYIGIATPYLFRQVLLTNESLRSRAGGLTARRLRSNSEKDTTMNNVKITRRGFATTAASGLAALGLLGATVRSAS